MNPFAAGRHAKCNTTAQPPASTSGRHPGPKQESGSCHNQHTHTQTDRQTAAGCVRTCICVGASQKPVRPHAVVYTASSHTHSHSHSNTHTQPPSPPPRRRAWWWWRLSGGSRLSLLYVDVDNTKTCSSTRPKNSSSSAAGQLPGARPPPVMASAIKPVPRNKQNLPSSNQATSLPPLT